MTDPFQFAFGLRAGARRHLGGEGIHFKIRNDSLQLLQARMQDPFPKVKNAIPRFRLEQLEQAHAKAKRVCGAGLLL